MKNVYFLSDAHLGSLAIPHARMQERRLVRFLDIRQIQSHSREYMRKQLTWFKRDTEIHINIVGEKAVHHHQNVVP